MSDSQVNFAANSDSEMTMIDSEFPPDLSDQLRMNQIAQSNADLFVDLMPKQVIMQEEIEQEWIET